MLYTDPSIDNYNDKYTHKDKDKVKHRKLPRKWVNEYRFKYPMLMNIG